MLAVKSLEVGVASSYSFRLLVWSEIDDTEVNGSFALFLEVEVSGETGIGLLLLACIEVFVVGTGPPDGSAIWLIGMTVSAVGLAVERDCHVVVYPISIPGLTRAPLFEIFQFRHQKTLFVLVRTHSTFWQGLASTHSWILSVIHPAVDLSSSPPSTEAPIRKDRTKVHFCLLYVH